MIGGNFLTFATWYRANFSRTRIKPACDYHHVDTIKRRSRIMHTRGGRYIDHRSFCSISSVFSCTQSIMWSLRKCSLWVLLQCFKYVKRVICKCRAFFLPLEDTRWDPWQSSAWASWLPPKYAAHVTVGQHENVFISSIFMQFKPSVVIWSAPLGPRHQQRSTDTKARACEIVNKRSYRGKVDWTHRDSPSAIQW